MRAYTEDIRRLAIDYLESGKSQRYVANLLNISSGVVNKWYIRYRREGHLQPRKRIGFKKKVSDEALISYVKLHPDSTLEMIADYFSMKAPSIYYRLKQLNYSYKKKRLPMWKQTQ